MKINIATGFFLPVPPAAGGATEKIWHRLSQVFAAAGHEVTFISRTWPGFPDRETLNGVRHIRLPGANHTRWLALNLWHDFWWGRRVARALPPADITVCNLVSLPISLRRLRPDVGCVVAVLARMPKGQTRFYNKVDLLLSLSPAVTEKIVSENPALAARIVPFPFPIDWSLHATARTNVENGGRGLPTPLPSLPLALSPQSHSGGIGRSRSTSTFSPPPPPLTIGYIGRLHPEKGIGLLLAAAAKLAARPALPPWRLQLLGPVSIPEGGGGEAWLNSLCAEFTPALGERLSTLAPEFDPAVLARKYAALDIFCYPSLADKGETFGVAVAESMAAGCVPVVSKLPCFNSLVDAGLNGFIFDHTADSAAGDLASILAALLIDESLRRELAANAQAHARQFDYAEIGRTISAEFAQLVAPAPV